MAEEDIREQIISKALEDPDFKQALIKDPKQALAKAFNINVPKGIEIRVVEETKNLFYLVIPASTHSHDPEHEIVGWG
ncbi:MAG TPA: NHLP leader peptide family RiPP precursor [Bacillota bacterium]|nr:NHLP leader peptide family RiPP precursor [Bacillota bacterium]